MSENKRDFRSRNFDPDARSRYIELLLKQLAVSEEKTDPSRVGSDKGKDHEAFDALMTAGELVRAVAGWALDHVYGVSLNTQKLLPFQPSKSRAHDEYIESRSVADRHEHELVGGENFEAGGDLTADQRRTIFRNLLFAGCGGFPHWLREEAFQALDGLTFGETAPILQAAPKTRRKVKYKELRAQLKLIAIVHFRAAAYGGKAKAQSFVAKVAGQEAETLRGWEKELRKELGRLEIARTIEFAENCASHVKHAQERRNNGFALSNREVWMRDFHETKYGAEALRAAVAELQNARLEMESGVITRVSPP